jgi:MFS family permease
MGDLAGTAAGILGLGGITAASLLAAFVGTHIHASTTPWAVAFMVYGAIGLGFLVAAGRTPESAPERAPESSPVQT